MENFLMFNISSAEDELTKNFICQKIFVDNVGFQFQMAGLVHKFTQAKTNEAKMRVALKFNTLLGKDNFIEQRYNEVKSKTNFKDKVKSEQFRTQGNTQYRNGDNRKALELYTKSIAYAPQNSSELHLAYANRSAVLRSMGKCRECLVDIERALSHGYPRDKSFKLLLREMQCHRDLENKKEQIESFKKASILLTSLPGNSEQQRWDMSEQLEKELKAPRKAVCTDTIIYPDKAPELSYGANPEVVGASSAVRIEYSEQQGRHLVATRDINIGDVLLIGENIVGAVQDPHKYDHCAHCHKLCFSLLPCHSCVWAMFCSEKCQNEANSKYHLSECATNSKFTHLHGKVVLGDTVDRIIRLLALIGIDNLQPYFKYARSNTKKSMNKEAKRTRGFNTHGVFDSTNINTIFNLINKIDDEHMPSLFIVAFFTLQVPRCFGISMTNPDFFAVAGLCLQLLDTTIFATISKSSITISKHLR